jgi:hypothetical protein
MGLRRRQRPGTTRNVVLADFATLRAPMDFARIFSAPFEDSEWPKKVAVGGIAGLLSFALVGLFLILGYLRRLAAGVLAGAPPSLPPWDDFEGDLVEGIRLFGILVIYLTPVFFLATFILPPAALLAAIAGPERFALPVLIGLCILLVPGIAVVAFTFPAAFLLYVRTGEFSVAFRFGEIFALIRENLTRYTTAFAASLALFFVAAFGIFISCIGIVFTGFVALCLSTACFAEAIQPGPERSS